MKKIAIALLLSVFVAMPAMAAGKSKSSDKSRASDRSQSADNSKFAVGASYGFGNGGVLSLRGDMSIADMTNNQPITVRVGYDRYSLDYSFIGSGYKWTYNIFYGGAYYDFGKLLNLDRKLHPFAGAGYGFGKVSCTGSSFCGSLGAPTVGGFYYIAGVQYDNTPQFAAEANFNGFGGLSLGANFKF